MFTLYRRAFAPPRESYWIGLLFTHKDGCGGGNSVTERSFSALISKVERHNLVRRGCDPFVQRRGPIHWTKVTEALGTRLGASQRHISDRFGAILHGAASFRYRNRAEITVLMREQQPYLL